MEDDFADKVDKLAKTFADGLRELLKGLRTNVISGPQAPQSPGPLPLPAMPVFTRTKPTEPLPITPPDMAMPLPPIETMPQPVAFDLRRKYLKEQLVDMAATDQTVFDINNVNTINNRQERELRFRQFQWMRRTSRDANNDYRRIEHLERQLELSRETITDVNI